MKKNPFLIDKKIIITESQTTALKGGLNAGGGDDPEGNEVTSWAGLCTIVNCPPPHEPTCVDGPNCDNTP